MGVNKRILDLESRTGGDNIIAVYWGDGLITANGETITIEDFKKRYPDHAVVNWDDDDE